MPFLALLLASCAAAPHRSSGTALEAKFHSGANSLGALSQHECIARGGAWSGAPGADVALCVRRVTDGGTACSDHSECQAYCITAGGYEPGDRAHGTCTHDYNATDCVQGVSNGRAEVVVCNCTGG